MEIFKEANKNPLYVNGDDIVRMLYKVWSGYTKFIRNILLANKSAVSIEFGKFVPTGKEFLFLPNSSLLSMGSYSYSSPSVDTKFVEQYVSYSSISIACGYPKQVCMNSIKQILHTTVELSKTQEVKLNFKVGVLSFKPKTLVFQSTKETNYHCSTAGISSERASNRWTYNPSNPNTISLGNVENKKIPNVSKESPNIPWPYLSAFYEEPSKRFTKKFEITKSMSPVQLLEEHKKQIREKQKQDENFLIQNNRDGQILAKIANTELKKEKEEKSFYNQALQKNFIEGNKSQIEKHKQEDLLKSEEKKIEKYDFFPFTYGSKLEEYQTHLKSQLKQEMVEKMNVDKEKFFKKKNLPDSYLTSFPLFLSQDKPVISRRNDTTHIKAVMGQALNRYEQELNELKSEKIKEEQRVLMAEKINEDFKIQSRISAEKNISQHNQFLLEQIEANVVFI